LNRLPLRVFFPIVAGLLFAILCFAASRENQILDVAGWTHSGWEEPVDIGTPADVLLLIFSLPALICLLPLLSLTYWIESELVLRTAWGLVAVVQWFLIGRYFDIRQRTLPVRGMGHGLLLRKLVFATAMTAGAMTLGCGLFNAAQGHYALWAMVMDGGFIVWGLIFVIASLRWRSSWARDDSISLHLS
jgi:hypothetical protein